MGYMRHHAIVVTSYSDIDIEVAHKKAREIFTVAPITLICKSDTNGYSSFFVGPDGSKEWWDTSDEGDKQREQFTQWLTKTERHFAYDWVVVQYGDDEKVTQICNHSDQESEIPF